MFKEINYEWEKEFELDKSIKNINEWNSSFGPKIISRNQDNKLKEVEFNLLTKNVFLEVFIIGEFNNWGKSENLEKYWMIPDEKHKFLTIKLNDTQIKHKDKYKFLVIDKQNKTKKYLSDPAGVYFDDFGNSILWDFQDPNSYKQKYNFIDNFQRPTKIIQTDLPGLIVHFIDKKTEIKGSDINQKEYFKFIAKSGVIEEIKKMGYNSIQFLPFAQSIDGDNWKFRYLVPFQFSIQKNLGNPDEFAEMIDEFHKMGISVIGDFVLGHIPHKDYKVFGQEANENGIHLFKKENQELLYIKDKTSWGTSRINFDDKEVREYFISSVIHFMKYYRIDGARIDNVDGIIRYGDSGEGDERLNGRTFLRELNSTIYSYNSKAIINFEAHYYAGDNAKMLVAPISSNKKALGATTYNSSRETYYFHTEYMLKMASEISVWKFKYINEEKEWGKSNSCIADFHNHDAAAGLMENRATGSYCFDTMMISSNENYYHTIGKMKVMESIISFSLEGRTLDLIQTFLLQRGTFEHDSSIHWDLKNLKNLIEFKKEINNIMENQAFWPIFTKNREFLNVDEKNKIMVIKRENNTGEEFIVLINISDWEINDYKIGIKNENNYKLIFNSDKEKYLGSGFNYYPEIFENKKSNSFEFFDKEIEIGTVKGYQTLIFKKID